MVEDTGALPVEDAYFARRQGQWEHTLSFVERTPPDLSDLIEDYAAGFGLSDGVHITLTTWSAGTDGMQRYRSYVYDHYLDVPAGDRQFLAGLYWER